MVHGFIVANKLTCYIDSSWLFCHTYVFNYNRFTFWRQTCVLCKQLCTSYHSYVLNPGMWKKKRKQLDFCESKVEALWR